MKRNFSLILLVFITFVSCQKQDPKQIVVENNNPPPYSGTPTIVVENYINRLFIDLVGREPTDTELKNEAAALKNAGLDNNARNQLITKLQTSEVFVEGDTSYKKAYYHRLYELFKGRFIEGATTDEIVEKKGNAEFSLLQDSLTGNTAGVETNRRIVKLYQAILDAEKQYQNKTIDIREVVFRMINNPIYDDINMNTFNFIRATFNDLFFRYPSQSEYDDVFNVIEYNQSGLIFGQTCGNKEEYIRILVNSREFHESLIRWTYSTLLAREAQSAEVAEKMTDFYTSHNLEKVQKDILLTDEYAGFTP